MIDQGDAHGQKTRATCLAVSFGPKPAVHLKLLDVAIGIVI